MDREPLKDVLKAMSEFGKKLDEQTRPVGEALSKIAESTRLKMENMRVQDPANLTRERFHMTALEREDIRLLGEVAKSQRQMIESIKELAGIFGNFVEQSDTAAAKQTKLSAAAVYVATLTLLATLATGLITVLK